MQAKANAPITPEVFPSVLIREETGLPVMLADDPLTAVVVGAGKVLDELSLLKEVTIQ